MIDINIINWNSKQKEYFLNYIKYLILEMIEI